MIKIFTDGACHNNPGKGGYAALIVTDQHEVWVKGRSSYTTNNRMEMLAALRALEATPEGSEIILHSDSQYLVKGASTWIAGWKRKGWQTEKGPVLNRDLWELIDKLQNSRRVKWKWVRGHAGHIENEACDEAANEALVCGRYDSLGESKPKAGTEGKPGSYSRTLDIRSSSGYGGITNKGFPRPGKKNFQSRAKRWGK